MRRGRVRTFARPAVVPLVVLVAWQLIAQAQLVSPVFLPSPKGVVDAGANLWSSGILGEGLRYTLATALTGWLIASLLGIVLAILITRSRYLVDALAPPLDFFRSLPAAAVIPSATLVLGFGRSMELSVIVFGAIWPVLLNAVQGILDTEPQLHEVAHSIQMSRARRVWSIELPSTLPAILLGVRTSLSLAVIIAVVAEMIASSGGLGYALIQASQRFQSGSVYALVLLLGAVGAAANGLVYAVERRILLRPTGGH
jgi:ABC-type nitrate/sulfonate/bicarbonate transport system, permease component